ncbi:MAG: hypothetical protein ACYC3X_18650 [Pirellulaceae bacterium]
MSQNFHAFDESPDFFVSCYHYVRSRLQDYGNCRQCGSHCALLANVCDTCGTQDPIRLPITWALLAVGLCGAVLVIWVRTL